MEDDLLMMEDVSKQNNTKEARLLKKQKNLAGRPSLIYRMIAGLIDLVIVFIVAILVECIFTVTIFKPLGYEDSINQANTMNEESHLFYKDGNNYKALDFAYEGEELNNKIKDSLLYYYANDERALTDNKMVEFTEKLISDPSFTSQNQEEVNAAYLSEYNKALEYFKSDEEYIKLVNKSYMILILTGALALIISSSIFYLVIPLSRKEGETIGYIIFKICVVDSKTNGQVKKSQIFIRALTFICFNIIISFLIYIAFNYFTLLPALASLVLVCFDKKNRGPHEYMSNTLVFLKRRADVMDDLNQMRKGG